MNEPLTGYCVRCKDKRPLEGARIVVKQTKRGPVSFFVAPCPVCTKNGKATDMWRVQGKETPATIEVAP